MQWYVRWGLFCSRCLLIDLREAHLFDIGGYRLVHVIGSLLGINEEPMQLEVEEVVKAVAHFRAPIEEKAIKDVGFEDDREQEVSVLKW